MWDPEKTVRCNVPPPPGRGRAGAHVKAHKAPSSFSAAPTSIISLQGKRHNCLVCCAWLFLLSFAFLIFALAAGVAFLAVLRSALPQVRILAFDVPWLRITNQSDTLLTAAFRAQLELYNKNSDTQLRFSDIMVDAVSNNIRLGNASVGGFVLETSNRTVLKVETTLLKGVVVNEDDAEELLEDAENGQLVVTTVMRGNVGFHLGALQMTRVPLLVVCRDINQSDVVFARRPGDCEVEIFKYR